MTQTPMDKNADYKGRLMGMALLNSRWTPEMKEEQDYLDACWGELLAPSGLFTGKPNPAREQELGDLVEAGVYRSLYNLDTKGTEGDRIFGQMRANIENAAALKNPVVIQALEQLIGIAEKYFGLGAESLHIVDNAFYQGIRDGYLEMNRKDPDGAAA